MMRSDAMDGGPLLLGLDVGSSRIKALLLDRRGREVAVSAVPTPFVHRDDAVEMTAGSLVGAVGEVLQTHQPHLHRVIAAGVCGIAESGVPLDAHGSVLAPVIAWYDPRGAEVAARLGQRFGDGLALRIGQRPRSVSSAAKLGWLVDHGCTGVRGWLGVPELIAWRLCGQRASEHSLASRTGWYDVLDHRWLSEVAVATGLPAAGLPEVVAAGAAVGLVNGGGAAWSGLPPGASVTLAGHDHLAGAGGAGVAATDMVDSTGSAEVILSHRPTVPDVARAIDMGVAVSVHPGGREWALLASAARAGMQLQRAAQRLGRAPAELDRLAAAQPPAGERDPEDPERVIAGIDPCRPGEAWSELLDALAARTADATRRLLDVAGAHDRLVVIGGGARSDPWLRAKLRRSPVPLARTRSAEAAARGAAATAGIAAGWWPDLTAAPAPGTEPV
jgi:xylulokinase